MPRKHQSTATARPPGAAFTHGPDRTHLTVPQHLQTHEATGYQSRSAR